MDYITSIRFEYYVEMRELSKARMNIHNFERAYSITDIESAFEDITNKIDQARNEPRTEVVFIKMSKHPLHARGLLFKSDGHTLLSHDNQNDINWQFINENIGDHRALETNEPKKKLSKRCK